MSLLRERIEQFVTALIAEETYDENEEIWVFAEGTACAVCTSSARRIACEFGGEVFGYLSKMNPTAEIGGALCGGHDFAVIAGRWIVDYWAFHVARIARTPVLDLNSPGESELASRLLGERESWEIVPI